MVPSLSVTWSLSEGENILIIKKLIKEDRVSCIWGKSWAHFKTPNCRYFQHDDNGGTARWRQITISDGTTGSTREQHLKENRCWQAISSSHVHSAVFHKAGSFFSF